MSEDECDFYNCNNDMWCEHHSWDDATQHLCRFNRCVEFHCLGCDMNLGGWGPIDCRCDKGWWEWLSIKWILWEWRWPWKKRKAASRDS